MQLVSLRLPDGGTDGMGFPLTGDTSLLELSTGEIDSLAAVDGTATYTLASLSSTLDALMAAVQPTNINTLDHVGAIDDGDHPDHHVVGALVDAAQQRYTTPHGFAGYQGYGIRDRPSNLTMAQITDKSQAFFRYAEHDPATCGGWDACWNKPEYDWLSRQYAVGTPTTTAPPRRRPSTRTRRCRPSTSRAARPSRRVRRTRRTARPRPRRSTGSPTATPATTGPSGRPSAAARGAGCRSPGRPLGRSTRWCCTTGPTATTASPARPSCSRTGRRWPSRRSRTMDPPPR
nr:hypothetical protein GCM10025699_43290 [Microbacterium flavescens]